MIRRLGSWAQQLVYRRAGRHSRMRLAPARLAVLIAALVVTSLTVAVVIADDEPDRQPVATSQTAPTTEADQDEATPNGPTRPSVVQPSSTIEATPTTPATVQPAPTLPEPSAPPQPAPVDPPPALAVATNPVRLRVPTIGVDAPIIPLGLNPDKTLEVPTTASDTGWWTGGSPPGDRGPAVIAGHVNLRSQPGVFADLDKVQPGDTIEVIGHDLVVVRFVVDRIERHPKDAFPTNEVYGPTGGPELRLITCGGAFNESTGHYLDNVIAFAHPAP